MPRKALNVTNAHRLHSLVRNYVQSKSTLFNIQLNERSFKTYHYIEHNLPNFEIEPLEKQIKVEN